MNLQNLQEAVIRYGSTDFKQDEIRVIKNMIRNAAAQKKINEKMGIVKNLTLANQSAIIYADEILETIPLLPSINFEQCQNFQDYKLDPATSINYFILKYNFYPYIEFGTSDDLSEYDKEIKLLITTKDGFWSTYDTLSLRISNVSEINDGYGWRFDLQLFDFTDGYKRGHFMTTMVLSDYEMFTFTCSSILNYDATFDDPTDISGQNYFNLHEYQDTHLLVEKVLISIDKCDLGIGNSLGTLNASDEYTIKPVKQNIWQYTTQNEVNSYYFPENFNNLYNEFANNIEIAFSYREEHSCFHESFEIIDDYYNDFQIKLDLMCLYEMIKFGAFMYKAISQSIQERVITSLEDEDLNLSAVLLRNDEIIFNRIENIPVLLMKSKQIDETVHSYIKNKIPYVRSIDYLLSWNNTEDPVPRLTRSVTLNPTYVVNEMLKADFSDEPLISISDLHKVYENDETIILFKVTMSPIEDVIIDGSTSYTGPFEIHNTTPNQLVGSFKCVTQAKIGVKNVTMTKIRVTITDMFILPKNSSGFGQVYTTELNFVFGFGDTKKYFSTGDDIGLQFDNTFMEYQGRVFYGYKTSLSNLNHYVIGVAGTESFFDLTKTVNANETIEITTPVNSAIKYETMNVLDKYGFRTKVGYRSASGGFQSASVVELTAERESLDYFAVSTGIYLYDTEGNRLSDKIKDLTGATIDQCGYQSVWFGISGELVYTSMYPSNGSDNQTIITSEYALANDAVIQQLLLGLEDLQNQFDDLLTRIEFLEAAFEEMNKRGPIFMQMLDFALSFAGPISAAFDMVAVAKQFTRDIVYQNKMNRLTIGQMRSSKALSEKDFNLSANQNRNQYVDGYLYKNKLDRQVIYGGSNDRPYFLNGNENVSKLDLAEKLDLMATVRTGGFVSLPDITETTKGLVTNSNVMNGLHPTFNVWARPLETLPKPLGSGLFKVGTNFSKIRRGNINKAFTTNTRLPFHTAGSFDDFKISDGKPVRTRRWIGVGEPNIRNQMTNDKGAGIGGFKYESELIGKCDGQLIWKHKQYDPNTLSNDALESLYFTAFKQSHPHLSMNQKYDRLINHTENRIGTSKLLYSYLPDSSFSEALDIFTNKVDLKYNLINQNCQTLMLNLLNYSQSGQALTSLTSDTQAALIRARLQFIEHSIKSSQSLYG